MSSPDAGSSVLWVAPQSLCTKPSKPILLLRSRWSSDRELHACVPLTLLYAHMTPETPAAIAAS